METTTNSRPIAMFGFLPSFSSLTNLRKSSRSGSVRSDNSTSQLIIIIILKYYNNILYNYIIIVLYMEQSTVWQLSTVLQ